MFAPVDRNFSIFWAAAGVVGHSSELSLAQCVALVTLGRKQSTVHIMSNIYGNVFPRLLLPFCSRFAHVWVVYGSYRFLFLQKKKHPRCLAHNLCCSVFTLVFLHLPSCGQENSFMFVCCFFRKIKWNSFYSETSSASFILEQVIPVY